MSETKAEYVITTRVNTGPDEVMVVFNQVCEWTDAVFVYQASCGEMNWADTYETLEEKRWKYCPFCGKLIKLIR